MDNRYPLNVAPRELYASREQETARYFDLDLRDRLQHIENNVPKSFKFTRFSSYMRGELSATEVEMIKDMSPEDIGLFADIQISTWLPKIPVWNWKRIIDLSRGDVHPGFGHAEELALLALREDGEPWSPNSLYEWFVTREGDWVIRLFDVRSRDSHGYNKEYSPNHFVKVNGENHGGPLGVLIIIYQMLIDNVSPDDRKALRSEQSRLKALLP